MVFWRRSTSHFYAPQDRNEGNYGSMALLALEASKWDGNALPVMARWSHRVGLKKGQQQVRSLWSEGTRIPKRRTHHGAPIHSIRSFIAGSVASGHSLSCKRRMNSRKAVHTVTTTSIQSMARSMVKWWTPLERRKEVKIR